MQWAIAFALFSVICAVWAFQRHPIYGLYFYLATTYVNPTQRWWSTYLPDLRWAVLAAAICVLAVLFHRGKLSERPPWASSAPVIILCLYAAWMWVQTPWALDVDEHLRGSATFTKYILAFWFVYRIADTKESIRDTMFFHSAGCAMLGLIARYFEQRENGRIEGVGAAGIEDANSLGMFLSTGAVICLCLVVSQRGWRRWASLGMLSVTLVGFTMTESRGAFLGLAAGTLVLLFAHSRAYTKSMLGIGLVALLVGVVAVSRDQSFRDRLETIGDVAADTEDKGADGSARSRAAIKDAQVRMAQDYPLGVGHRGTVVLAPRYMDRFWLVGGGEDPNASRSSHNTFLTALVEQGVPGVSLFLILVGWVLATIWRVRGMGRRKDDPELVMLAAGLCAGLMVVLVAGLATDYMITEVQFWLFGLLVSAMRLLRPTVYPVLDPVSAEKTTRPVTTIGAIRAGGRCDSE